ncbi:TULIP family P47-like protein [Mangrovihabitans endophyticus]|uniref:Protein OrfX2/OrfX3/P47 domain-containing protein n=1 Tax=Mangrovihabitans endophyticus TaxID=1751298 RepID=A0A8J3BVP8_9ACTN|nr:TULIP family P47-like protein [Mangrovihabitans endophyticus]GGK72713.1 hypothetical protein GCM10012284_03220 [Mangrovihabitans endophyticus]
MAPPMLTLFGWDTVFAVNYTKLNEAIVKSKTTPPDFAQTETGLELSGDWSDWQLSTGGDGHNVQMRCPILTGTATDGTENIDLSGGWVEILVQLDLIPDPSYVYEDPTGTGGTPVKMPVRTAGTPARPAVSLISTSFDTLTGLWKYVVPGLFLDWFNAHIEEFNHVFAVTVINTLADVGDYQWLKPTDVSYACADAIDDSPDHSVFGSLCLTEGRTTSDNPNLSQSIDSRLLADMPATANSAFAIAPERVTSKLLLPGAIHCIQGSDASDFEIINDNLWVANKNDVIWGNFELDNGDRVQPRIAKNKFQIGLKGEFVRVEVTDATFDWPGWHGPGHITVHMNYVQEFAFELQEAPQGYIFVPKEGVGTKTVTASVISDKDVLIFEIVLGVAVGIALACIGSALGARLGSAAQKGVTSATEGAVQVSEAAIEEVVGEAGSQAVRAAEREAASAAAESIAHAANPSYYQKFTTALLANKWKIFGGMIGSILATPVGLIGEITKAVADGDVEKIPAFDKFAAQCIGSTTFPNVGDTWKPSTAGLQGPLVIRGELST